MRFWKGSLLVPMGMLLLFFGCGKNEEDLYLLKAESALKVIELEGMRCVVRCKLNITTWEVAIHEGQDFQGAFRYLEKREVSALLKDFDASVAVVMEKKEAVSRPPRKYAETSFLWDRLYWIYMRLYKLAVDPVSAGSGSMNRKEIAALEKGLAGTVSELRSMLGIKGRRQD